MSPHLCVVAVGELDSRLHCFHIIILVLKHNIGKLLCYLFDIKKDA